MEGAHSCERSGFPATPGDEGVATSRHFVRKPPESDTAGASPYRKVPIGLRFITQLRKASWASHAFSRKFRNLPNHSF